MLWKKHYWGQYRLHKERCNSVKTTTTHPDPSIGVASLPLISADHHRLIKAHTPMSNLYYRFWQFNSSLLWSNWSLWQLNLSLKQLNSSHWQLNSSHWLLNSLLWHKISSVKRFPAAANMKIRCCSCNNCSKQAVILLFSNIRNSSPLTMGMVAHKQVN